MKFKRLFAAVAVVAGLIVSGASVANAEDVLKIGVIGPLTGAAANWGQANAEGAKLIAKHYNDAGGVSVGGKKYKIEIISYDDMYSTPGAVAAYQRLVNQDGVKYIDVIAGISTMAVKSFAKDDHVVVMTAGYITDELDPKDSQYMYRMWGVPQDFFPPLYDTVAKLFPERRVALINPNDESARISGEIAAAAYKKNGYTVLMNDLYERSQKDFAPLVTKIIGTNPDLVDLCTTAPAQAALLVRMLREFGYKGQILISGSTVWREVVAGAGKQNAEGVINTLYVDPANEGYRKLEAEYVKAVGQEPNEVMAGYTDGVNFLIQSIAASGSATDTSKFEAGFFKAAQAPFVSVQGEKLTISGKEKYGVEHQIDAYRYLGVIKNGEPVVIGKFK
jgi:branched-chain amino acid transport system substrate-binding protein